MMGTYVIMPQNGSELYHHGVLGMKWGVRRYQSYAEKPRGSGKTGIEKIKERRADRKAKKQEKIHQKALKDSTTAKKLYKNRNKLTAEEFEERANKYILEKQLKDCFDTKETSIGRKAVNKVMTDVAASAIKIGLLAGAGYLASKTPLGKQITENAKGVFNTAKKIYGVTHKDGGVRQTIANTEAAKTFVNTVDSVAEAAKNTRKAAATSDVGRAYVRAVNRVAQTKPVSGALRDAEAIRRRASKSEFARKYVGTVRKITRKKSEG